MPEKKKTAVPRLRFPEFRDAGPWEVKRLGELSDVRDGTHDSPKFYNVGKPLVTSKNLLPDGSLDLNNVNLISDGDYEQINKRSKVDAGDILFGMIGTIGNPVMVNSEGFAIKNVALIKEKNGLLNKYLVHFLNSQYITQKIHILMSGNSQKFIALGKIRGLTFPVPKIEEQQKIADCLSSLDDLIRAEASRLEALKNHKKGLMQQLFTHEGETIPRLRFSKFRDAGPWEMRRLGEVCEINPPSGPLPPSFVYIDLESVEDGELIQKKVIYQKDAPSRAQRVLRKGDVIYQMVRPYQRNNLLFEPDDSQNYVASTGYAQLRAKVSNVFLYQLIHTEPFTKSVIEKCTGSNYPAISSSDLAKVRVGIPSFPEQQKIADCLSSLDDLIRAQGERIEVLKQHKKGLMQQLFPSLDEVRG